MKWEGDVCECFIICIALIVPQIICESTPDTHPVEQCAPPLESLGNKNDEDNSYDVEEGKNYILMKV